MIMANLVGVIVFFILKINYIYINNLKIFTLIITIISL